MKTLRNAVPMVALAALAAAGCFLVSGQFVVNHALPSPSTFQSAGTFAGVAVDLNDISEYSDHKGDLKRVEDLALIGDFHNNSGTAVNVDVYIVPAGTISLTPAQVLSTGIKLWGSLSVPGNSTVSVDWNKSATLFTGRQTLIDEIKGDGQFSLYAVASGAFDVTLTKGAVIAVIAAAK